MKITLFESLYSKEAKGVIDAAEWVKAIRDGKYRKTVDAIREHLEAGKKELAGKTKMKLPAVVFAGDCRKGRFYTKTTERTGWAMFDFDGLTEEQARAARDLMRACQWVVMAHITSSGHGLRVVANIGKVHIDVYRDAYERVAGHLKEMTGLEPDMQCKDFARTSLASYDPDIYFNPEAGVFDYGEGCNPLRYVPVTGPDTSEDFRIPADVFADSCGSTERQAHTAAPDGGRTQERGTGTDTETVIERFFSMNTYSEGSRHRTLLHLGSYLKWRGVESWQMDGAIAGICRRAVQPGMPEKEVRNAVMWGYSHGQEGTKNSGASAHNAHFFNMSTGSVNNFAKRADNVYVTENRVLPEMENGNEKDEDETVDEHCRCFPDEIYENLPDDLKRLLVIAKDKKERDVILLSAITTLSGLFPALRTMYGNRLYAANLYTAIIAAAGAGKGCAQYSSILGSKIHEEMEMIYRSEKKEYEKKLMGWEMEMRTAFREKRLPNIELKPEEPVRQMLMLMANTSKSQMMHDMFTSKEDGNILFVPEIDALSVALNTDYGKHTAELRMFFHHEKVGQRFKTDKEPIEIDKPKLSLLMTGTPEQLARFIKTAEDGMYSRFMFYMFSPSYEWKSQSPLDGNGEIDAKELFGEMAEKLKVNFFSSRGKMVMINFTREQWDRHAELFGTELGLVAAEGYTGTAAIVLRAGLIAVRVAMVLCGLRIMEAGWQVSEYTCQDTDFDTALGIVATVLKHSEHISTMINELPARKRITNFYRLLPVLKGMGGKFRYMDFKDAALRNGSNVIAARRALKRYVESGILGRENDYYVKTRKLK